MITWGTMFSVCDPERGFSTCTRRACTGSCMDSSVSIRVHRRKDTRSTTSTSRRPAICLGDGGLGGLEWGGQRRCWRRGRGTDGEHCGLEKKGEWFVSGLERWLMWVLKKHRRLQTPLNRPQVCLQLLVREVRVTNAADPLLTASNRNGLLNASYSNKYALTNDLQAVY